MTLIKHFDEKVFWLTHLFHVSSHGSIIGLLGELSDPMDIRTPHTGKPTEALTLYCPHEELKVSVLQEFLLIDQKYTERLDTLDEYHADIVWYVLCVIHE